MSNTEKKIARAMPMETIMTRLKSKQKIIEKNQNSHEKAKKLGRPLKIKQKIKKIENVEKKTEEKCEIYPEKPKRKIVNKKIVLAPRHNYQLIGNTKSCNKRKLNIPKKVSEIILLSVPTLEPEAIQETSIGEMIKIIEDSGGLDDEDLLEILTCPSPVWWEDPPDGYTEEPLYSRPQPESQQKSIKTQLLEEQNKEKKNEVSKAVLSSQKVENGISVSSLGINVKNRGKIFINKRSKLESLLGNIRNKNSDVIRTITNSNNENLRIVENIAERIVKNSVKHKANVNCLKKSDELNICNNKGEKIHNNNSEIINLEINNKKRKRNSDSLDLSDLEDDDILIHLQNIDIPMKNLNQKKKHDVKLHVSEQDLILKNKDHDVLSVSKKGVKPKQIDDHVLEVPKKGLHEKNIDYEVLNSTKDFNQKNPDDGNLDVTKKDLNHDESLGILTTDKYKNNVLDILVSDLKQKRSLDIAMTVYEDLEQDNHVDMPRTDLYQDKHANILADLNQEKQSHVQESDDQSEAPLTDFNQRVHLNESPLKLNDIVRRNSVNSNLSDKDMSAEYLDMTLFEEEISDTSNDNNNTNLATNGEKNEKCKRNNDVNEKLNNKSLKINKNAELLTVYKILTKDTFTDSNELKKVQSKKSEIKKDNEIDNYYRKSKNFKLDRGIAVTNWDAITNKEKDKAILVSEADAIRYCFVCSSIYDTENCGYCEKKSKIQHEVFSCEICNIIVNSKSAILEHFNVHLNQGNS